jgi:prophage regulatory protein
MSNNFEEDGALRLRQILYPAGPIPVSKSSWWAGVKAGIYPRPIKLGLRITAWRKSDIQALVKRGVEGRDGAHRTAAAASGTPRCCDLRCETSDVDS